MPLTKREKQIVERAIDLTISNSKRGFAIPNGLYLRIIGDENLCRKYAEFYDSQNGMHELNSNEKLLARILLLTQFQMMG